MVASTASKNSTPRCSRRASYQRPAKRYSASASSQSEREDSPLAKFVLGAAAHVVPGHSAGLVGEGPAGAPLDFGGPGRFDISGTFRRRVVKAGQQFGRDIGTFIEGQRQGFAQKILRS
jgi:hypothetical protein